MQSVTSFFRRLIFIILFIIVYLLFIAYSFQRNTKSTPQPPTVNKITFGLPVRLTIPVINVNAAIQSIGVTAGGEMDVPNNSIDVGWFKLGTRPGEKGSAVIVGHVDDAQGQSGVFMNLYQLKNGDTLYIEDDAGKTTSFVVRESREYDPGYAEEVFSSNDMAHLNLITCDGVWDGIKKSYSKRLVVFTDAN